MEEGRSFWTRTWKTVDPKRISDAIALSDRSDDPMIDWLDLHRAKTVCDAGCGCGVYALKLAGHGFSVAGFDLAEHAVSLARDLLAKHGYPTADFKQADIRSTGYSSESFDAVVARSVADHLPFKEGLAAVKELLRITKPDGCVLISLDKTDEEYESEPHEVNEDGDYCYTDGKWAGMVFHPWSLREIGMLSAGSAHASVLSGEDGYIIALEKNSVLQA